ncbi:MFS transporter [Octadecabacter sp. R77987]|uniref:MFS transporter n=1 Tax=Octadecabacter sp. R77987 TaxID=3093874 RepID=UPI00366D7D5E
MIAPDRLARSGAVWGLALGQTLGYACLYYVFGALIIAWQADLGWSKSALALGPTVAILIAAVLAPVMGRLVDRGVGAWLLTGGAAFGALALFTLGRIETQAQYLAAWAMIGVAQAACLYEVSFAFLVRRLGPSARAAIVRITLIAGFAGTLAFPAGALLSDAFGWRGAVTVAALVMLFILMPVQGWAVFRLRRDAPVPTVESAAADMAATATALRRPAFWALGAALAAIALDHWLLVQFMVPILVEQGHSHGFAVGIAALIGPAQVAGRLLLLTIEKSLSTGRAMLIALAGLFLATGLLIFAGVAPWLAVVFGIMHGGAIGSMTILRPVVIQAVLGQAGYGAIAGFIQIGPLLAGAAAPILGAVLLAGPGIMGVFAFSLFLSGAAFLLVRGLRIVG